MGSGEVSTSSIQQEWQFLQRVMKDLNEEFWDIKEAIQEKFLPALFGDDITNNILRRITFSLSISVGLLFWTQWKQQMLIGWHGW
jgi:hypothetical protein